MAFEQDLRAHLEALERVAPTEAVLPPRQLDEHELHLHLLDRLRAMERAGQVRAATLLFDKWPSKLPSFARYLEMLPRQLAPVDPQEAISFARRALDAAIDCLDPDIALVDQFELRRLVGGFDTGHAQLASYALENHLVRREHPHPARLTELGRVFLRLRGKDAVRWLVTIEVTRSTGPYDPWHASHELLKEAATPRGITPHFDGNTMYFEYSGEAFNRLVGLEVRALRDRGSRSEP